MNKKIIVLLVAFFSVAGFSSCEDCIQCEVIGNAIDSLVMIDTNNVYYNEFCGTPSEVEAFEADVKYDAETRSCRVYSIRKIATGDVLISHIYCGGIQHLQAYEYGLDTLLYTTYIGQDAEWVVDTTIVNPGAWNCN